MIEMHLIREGGTNEDEEMEAKPAVLTYKFQNGVCVRVCVRAHVCLCVYFKL